MILPGSMSGPQFLDGDLVLFSFSGAEITFRLPVLPKFSDVVNSVSQQVDFSDGDTSTWDQGDQCKSIELVRQKWKYEDVERNSLVASGGLYVYLAEHNENYLNSSSGMDYVAFSAELLGQAKVEGFSDDNMPEGENVPCAENNYLARDIENDFGSNWLLLQLYFIPGQPASPTLYMPLNNRLYLEVSFCVQALVNDYTKNPYSNEQYADVTTQMFDEFISQIQIDYSPSEA